jgi:hypothetical protein
METRRRREEVLAVAKTSLIAVWINPTLRRFAFLEGMD